MARLLLGVSGGIAAYKAVELVRLATKAGHSVQVIQTPASQRFVGAATFEGITGRPVLDDEFELDPSGGISHLEVVGRCDAFVIAPATANTLAKLAGGHADNLLTSAALASTAPLVIAPAMNNHMWDHPATRGNVETLRLRGATVVAPGTGLLASKGEWGEGRLAEPAEILAAVEGVLAPRSLEGVRVLVTAGGTREPIDSVRYVGNRSSGRMGVALAQEAARRGASVSLVAANVSLPTPSSTIHVSTAAELQEAAGREFASADVLLMAAAVADFRPADAVTEKIGKGGRDELVLKLSATPDILTSLSAARRADQVLVGFAAEHGDGGLERARAKLERKGLDAVVHNDISDPGIGFDSPDNEVTILTASGDRAVARGPKAAVAAAILDVVSELRKSRAHA